MRSVQPPPDMGLLHVSEPGGIEESGECTLPPGQFDGAPERYKLSGDHGGENTSFLMSPPTRKLMGRTNKQADIFAGMKTLGERIRAKRKARGLSQEQLGKAAGLTQAAIGQLESGSTVGTTRLVHIASALGVSPAWLQTGEGPEEDALSKVKQRVINAIERLPVERQEEEAAYLEGVARRLEGDN